MNNYTIPQMASVSDFQRRYAKLIADAKKSDQPLLILRKNKVEAILLNPHLYQEMMEKVRQYEEEQALEAIAHFRKEKKAGRLLKGEKASDLFR